MSSKVTDDNFVYGNRHHRFIAIEYDLKGNVKSFILYLSKRQFFLSIDRLTDEITIIPDLFEMYAGDDIIDILKCMPLLQINKSNMLTMHVDSPFFRIIHNKSSDKIYINKLWNPFLMWCYNLKNDISKQYSFKTKVIDLFENDAWIKRRVSDDEYIRMIILINEFDNLLDDLFINIKHLSVFVHPDFHYINEEFKQTFIQITMFNKIIVDKLFSNNINKCLELLQLMQKWSWFENILIPMECIKIIFNYVDYWNNNPLQMVLVENMENDVYYDHFHNCVSDMFQPVRVDSSMVLDLWGS